ncbi:MAG: GGDEF domain-containing protein [Acidimicrobiales bacterium]
MRPEGASVVPAHRLLDMAGALSDGAARMHAQLEHLEPSERDALIDLVAAQVSDIVNMWANLVRDVVSHRGTVENPMSAHRGRRAGVHERDEGTEGRASNVAIQAVPDARPGSSYRRHTPQPPPLDPGDHDGLTRDELTGVLNRQAGFTSLGREVERCRQTGSRFILGYLNVDGVRTVNEEQGPRAGDELLRKVTAALRATLRSYDVILRLGGDEFLFSLPGADMATAEQRIKEFAAILGEESPGASASVGFADMHQGDTLDELVARADNALVQIRRRQRRHR